MELTVSEAAAKKGVTPAAVRRAIQRGRLPARAVHTPGLPHGRWSLREEDVLNWTPAKSPSEKGQRRAQMARDLQAIERKAALRAARGSLAGGRVTLDDYLAEKHAETERER